MSVCQRADWRDTSFICPSNATQDGIDVNTNAAVYLANFRINPTATVTAGNCLSVTSPTQNQRTVIRDMFLQACWTTINMNNAALWTIDGNFISAAAPPVLLHLTVLAAMLARLELAIVLLAIPPPVSA